MSTDGDSGPGDSAESAVSALAAGLADSGVSHAVIEPRLSLENLLLPNVITGVREEGVLRYSLSIGFRASWASHRDATPTPSSRRSHPCWASRPPPP
ncbi:hypothetical protein [Streptomyces bobili]|uniref:hypothetical protein n=1 Tax=Streptomyces bobili TaxID=67280 RepID=UPI001FC90A57|nr:hypothetical protein [Streptomyces bobili]